jgi:methanogenic corrinoid protein MtbC1
MTLLPELCYTMGMTDFGSRLRELRKARGLRQKDLARALGVAQTTVANYEQRTRFPDERTLQGIADYFDVSLDYLMGRSDVNLLAQQASYPGHFPGGDEEELPPMSPLARQYLRLLLRGERGQAGEIVRRALGEGEGLRQIYRDVFERTLREVGRLWRRGELDVGMEHYFSASTQIIMSQIYPYLGAQRREEKPLSVLGMAVCGEFHAIGVRMVTDLLELAGWRSFYMGANLCNEDIVKRVLDQRPQLLALSATMSYNVDPVARAIRALRSAEGLRDLVILVGGRAFNQDPELWKRVRADGYARNAEEAVGVAERLVQRRAAAGA